MALHAFDSQGPTCAGTEPISEARSGSMCSPLPGGKGLLGLAGPSRDIADAVLAGDTPDQWCGWEVGVKQWPPLEGPDGHHSFRMLSAGRQSG